MHNEAMWNRACSSATASEFETPRPASGLGRGLPSSSGAGSARCSRWPDARRPAPRSTATSSLGHTLPPVLEDPQRGRTPLRRSRGRPRGRPHRDICRVLRIRRSSTPLSVVHGVRSDTQCLQGFPCRLHPRVVRSRSACGPRSGPFFRAKRILLVPRARLPRSHSSGRVQAPSFSSSARTRCRNSAISARKAAISPSDPVARGERWAPERTSPRSDICARNSCSSSGG